MFDLKRVLDDKVNQFIAENAGAEEREFLNQLLVYHRVVDKVNKFIYEECQQKKIAIYGNGAITKEFFYAIGVPENIVCIIDCKNKAPAFWKLENISVIPIDELKEYCPEIVIIPSMVYEDEMRNELLVSNFSGKIVGLHSWIKEQGILLEKEFHWYKSAAKYEIINHEYCDFLESGKGINLKRVILGLLCIRDYPHAIQLTKQYFEKKEEPAYFELIKEIEQVFEEVRGQVLRLEKPHLMMYVVDSLAQSELKNMPLLQKIADENFSFECLMTQYGSTRECVASWLTGYQLIKDKLYERRYFTKKDGKLFPFLSKNQYKINIFFDNHDYAFSKLDELEGLCNTEIASEVFFLGLCEVLNSGKSTFNYMHTLAELHSPFWNPLFEKRLLQYNQKVHFSDFMEQYKSAEKYIEEILFFYYNLFKSSVVTQIIMGDHGILLENEYTYAYDGIEKKEYQNRWFREKNNPTCIIIDKMLGKGKNNNLICVYSMAEIFVKVLSREIFAYELEKQDDRYVLLEIIPTYNQKSIRKYIEKDMQKWIMGMVGIWTKQDVYLRLENQEELYFIHGEEENMINGELYYEKIETYREMLRDNHGIEEMLKMDRFSYHREVIAGEKDICKGKVK